MRNRHRYPKDWRKRVKALREERGNTCQECGIEHGTPKESQWTGRTWPVWLQGAHPDHNPEDPNARIVIVCPYCHWHKYRKPTQIPQWYIEKLKHKKLIDRAYCL